jgi:hypothetical protein
MSWRRAPALAVAVAAFVAAGLSATVMHHQPRLPLAPAAATADAVRALAPKHGHQPLMWNHTEVSAVDGQLARVSFYSGTRIVAEVAVRGDGSVDQAIDFKALRVPYGNSLAYEPAVLIGLGALFVLMTGVSPFRRLRNLDVAALLSLIAPVVMLQYRYPSASVLAAVPGLGYLLGRCAWVALGPAREPRSPTTSLFELATPSLNPARRVRLLRILLLVVALIVTTVGVGSQDAVDVIYAVMEGATKLLHGVLPYGHLPGDVIHGDTYPILSYALYSPVAALAPVSSTWDSVDLALGVAVLAALASAEALLRAVGAGLPLLRSSRDPQRELAGLRGAIAWLAFPPLLITVSTGTTDVVLAAMLVFGVLLWRRPGISSGLVAAAAWFKLAPAALIPLWLAPLRGRRLAAAAGAVAAVSAAMVALLVWLGGIHGPAAMIHAISFQFSRASPQSVWSVLGIEGLQPLMQAGLVALVAGAAVRLRRDSALSADRARIAALAAAVMLGLELSADYWAFLYVIWVVPLIGLSVLAEPVGAPAAEPSRPGRLVGELLPAPSG